MKPEFLPEFLYVGTHRKAHHGDAADIGFGIYAFQKTAAGFQGPARLTPTPQPGWIDLHPSGRFLYAVNEVKNFEGTEGGDISAFAIDPHSGALTLLNSHPTPAQPCHCAVEASGRYLLVATFGGGSVHLYPLGPDGRIGPQTDSHRHAGSSVHPRRQTHPHAHAVGIDPGNRFVLVPDLGTDQVLVYELDLDGGKLLPRPEHSVRLPPASGPRHVTFGAQGRFVYLMNEMSAKITAFAFDPANGALTEIQTVDTLPENFPGLRSGAAIALHPAGHFLYATTRSHGSSGEPPIRGLDALVWFRVDAQSGLLAPRGRVPSGGEIPRSFAFDASGDHLLVGHQASASIVTFRIDPQTGAPSATGQALAVPVPVCLRFTGAN